MPGFKNVFIPNTLGLIFLKLSTVYREVELLSYISSEKEINWNSWWIFPFLECHIDSSFVALQIDVIQIPLLILGIDVLFLSCRWCWMASFYFIILFSWDSCFVDNGSDLTLSSLLPVGYFFLDVHCYSQRTKAVVLTVGLCFLIISITI